MSTFRVLMQDNDDNFQFAVYIEADTAETAENSAIEEFSYMNVTVVGIREVIYEQ